MDMSPFRQRLVAKTGADAAAPFKPAVKATSEIAAAHESPAAGKPIAVFTGGCKLDGEIIWARIFRNATNECRADVAICFGQNVFLRPLLLSEIALDSGVIYSRGKGANIDPPGAVRFYDGTQTAADPLIVAREGATKVPAWKGYCYAVLENILLADKYEAIVTDNGTDDTTTIITGPCDTTLEGIELIADPATGKFYGIEFPQSGEPNIITSDGCAVLNRVAMKFETFDIYSDRIFPIACEGVVSIIHFDGLAGMPPATFVGPYISIVDPVNGEFLYRSVAWLAPLVEFSELPGAASDVDWKLSYKVPGESSMYMLLRIFDPAQTEATDYFTAEGEPWPPTTNIAGMMIDVSEQNVRTYPGPDPDFPNPQVWGEQDLINRRQWPYPRSYAPDWWTDGAPIVDDIIYMRTPGASVELAASKVSGSDILVYRIEHSSGGMATSMTATVTPPAGWTGSGLRYDEETNLILLSVSPPTPESSLLSPRLYKIGPAGSVSFVELPGTAKLASVKLSLNAPGVVALVNWDASKIWTHRIGAVPADTLIYDDDAPDSDPYVDLPRNKIRMPVASGTVIFTAGQIEHEDISIVDLIKDICVLRGYDVADLFFEGMETLACRGMRLNASVACADLLNRIGTLYGFVFAETDGKLKFVRKRTAIGTYTPDVVLTEADLVEGEQVIAAQRNAATKVLTSLGLTWIDPDRDFETNDIVAYRTTGIFTGDASARDERISLPLVIAAAAARKLLFESFFAQVEAETRFSVRLAPKHLRIEPGTLIELTAGGAERLAFVRRVTHHPADNTLGVEAEAFMAQAAPTIEGPGGEPPPPPGDAVAGSYIHLDLPLMRSGDFVNATTIRQYHGITSRGFGDWVYADPYKSRNGSTFTKILDYDRPPMTVARAQNALAQPALLFAMDETSQLIVAVESGEASDFATVTYVEQMNGANLCAYGRPGKWEILSFQTVVDNGNGTITLSNLQRGLFGTHMVYEPGSADHGAGDYVCFLADLKLVSSLYPSSDRNVRERFGIATDTADIAASSPVWHRITGISLRPRQPANLRAVHTPGASTLEISWDPASTIPGNWNDGGSVLPMAESELYGIYIEADSITGSYSFTTTARSYSWADYGADLGVNALAHDVIFEVSVWQISAAWGEGPRATVIGREA